MSDHELDEWKTEWQSLGGRADFVEELAARVAKDRRRIQGGVVTEGIAAILGLALCGWMVVKTRGVPLMVVFSIALCVFIAVWVTRLVLLRQGSYSPEQSGLDAFVALTRRRIGDDRKWVDFGTRWVILFMGFGALWGVWAFISRYAAYRAAPGVAVVGFGVPQLVFAGVLLFYRKKRRLLDAQRDRFEALVADRTLDG